MIEQPVETVNAECVEAVASLDPGFRPWLTGEQLERYYATRVLSEEATRAMVGSLNGKSHDPAWLAEFVAEGDPRSSDTQSLAELFSLTDHLWPRGSRLPLDKLLTRLGRLTGHDYTAAAFLYRGEQNTRIYFHEIELLWKSVVKFGYRQEEALRVVADAILNQMAADTAWPSLVGPGN